MIIRLEKNSTTPEKRSFLLNRLREMKFDFLLLEEKDEIIVPKLTDEEVLKPFDFISESIVIESPYQLSSKKYKTKTSFEVNGSTVAQGTFNVIAGPCSVESEEQIFATAQLLSKLGIRFIRGGAFKPRTSPYTFRGLGLNGLKLINEAARQYGLAVVTELLDLSLIEDVYAYADIIQVGSRNMSNFYMLAELGKIKKPVMLKRGMSARMNEWLLAADYILSGGNENVILCERGIRSFDPERRNVFDLGIIPLIKSVSHLPVFADPSHGTGVAQMVPTMSLAAVAAGADGLMIEIHPRPAEALSDKQQALSFTEFENLYKKIQPFLSLTDKEVSRPSPQGFLKTQSL